MSSYSMKTWEMYAIDDLFFGLPRTKELKCGVKSWCYHFKKNQSQYKFEYINYLYFKICIQILKLIPTEYILESSKGFKDLLEIAFVFQHTNETEQYRFATFFNLD